MVFVKWILSRRNRPGGSFYLENTGFDEVRRGRVICLTLVEELGGAL